MAPPPLPPDYSGNQSGSAVKNDMMDMGWSMPTSNTTQPNPTTVANTDDDWGNAGWGFPGGNTADNNKPPENNFQQAGGNPHTSGFSNEISSSKTPNSAANTNQVTFLRALCCFVVVAWKPFILVLISLYTNIYIDINIAGLYILFGLLSKE